ncbi:MAG: hypothetical protein R2882_13895 [Gemmatimonadales bacterium]
MWRRQAGRLGPDPEQPGSLSLGVDGLPAGATAHVEVSGPGGYRHNVATTETLTGLVPGTYTVQATEVVAEGDIYQPAPVSQSAVVRSAATTSAQVTHGIATGRIDLAVSGVVGGSANVAFHGPDGSDRTVTAAGLVTGLAPGTWCCGRSRSRWMATSSRRRPIRCWCW